MSDLNPKTFSVLDALQGRSYPEDDVTVYTDVEALYQYEHVNALVNDALNGDTANQYESQLNGLRERIKASALIIHMRGYAPAIAKTLVAETRAKFQLDSSVLIDQDTDAFRWLNKRSIAESMIRVTNAEGAVDERLFTVDDVEAFDDFLTPDEMQKLVDKSFELSFRGMAFDAAVSPDFS
jgi:hypothetical protein